MLLLCCTTYGCTICTKKVLALAAVTSASSSQQPACRNTQSVKRLSAALLGRCKKSLCSWCVCAAGPCCFPLFDSVIGYIETALPCALYTGFAELALELIPQRPTDLSFSHVLQSDMCRGAVGQSKFAWVLCVIASDGLQQGRHAGRPSRPFWLMLSGQNALDKVVCTSQSSREAGRQQAFGPTSLGKQCHASPISEVVTKAEAGHGMAPGETAGWFQLLLFEQDFGMLKLRNPCAMTGYWY